MTILLRGSVAVLAAVALAACASKNDGATVATATGDITPTPIAAGYAAGSVEEFEQSVGHIVRFDYDEATIRNDAAATLERQADWLNTYPSALLVIGGHADERGTREYNLGLGERRANAVKEYLVTLGVAESRLKTISYGKERPLCVESSESCWGMNRRGTSVAQ